jgi:hypothetical protein
MYFKSLFSHVLMASFLFSPAMSQAESRITIEQMSKRFEIQRLKADLRAKREELASVIVGKSIIENFQNDNLTAKFYSQSGQAITYQIMGGSIAGMFTAKMVVDTVLRLREVGRGGTTIVMFVGSFVLGWSADEIYDAYLARDHNEYKFFKYQSAELVVERHARLAQQELKLAEEVANLEMKIKALE